MQRFEPLDILCFIFNSYYYYSFDLHAEFGAP